MTEKQFESFLEKSIINFGDGYVDASRIPYAKHERSERYSRKIRKLIKKRKRFYFPVIKTGFRRTVTVTIVIIIMMFTMVLSVGAWRRTFFSFITKPFATHTDVEAAKDDAAPAEIERIYEPVFIPDGFTLTDRTDIRELFVSRTYSDGDRQFEIEQWVKSEYQPSVNTEGYEMMPVRINGCEGFIIDMPDTERCLLSWDMGGYIFQITGSIGKDSIIKIAESVI